MNMAAFSELLSTPNNFVRLEESIRGMPLLPSGCGVNNNITGDGYNEVGAISPRCYYHMVLSASRHYIMIMEIF